MEPRDEIVAAGGLVIDASDEQTPRVLLVHRPKYDDWSYPKGKLDPGETIEIAALREVEEETGLRCRIIRELTSVHYLYRGRGGEIHVNMYEIDEARWCTVSDAMARLRYDHDRQILMALFDPARHTP